jgi:hypothetical protein
MRTYKKRMKREKEAGHVQGISEDSMRVLLTTDPSGLLADARRLGATTSPD